MAKERNLAWADEMAAKASLENFLETALRHKDDRQVFKRLRESVKVADDTFLRWQKREIMSMLAKHHTPTLEDLTVSARVAFELARLPPMLMRFVSDKVEDMPLHISPAVREELEQKIAGGRLPVRQTIHESLSTHFNSWASQRRMEIIDFHARHPDATIVVDGLPAEGGTLPARLQSRKNDLDTFLKSGIRTTRKLHVLPKARFGRTPASAA